MTLRNATTAMDAEHLKETPYQRSDDSTLTILSIDADAVPKDECFLRRLGHRVHLADTAVSAFRRLPGADLVILTMNLRDVDSYDFCRELRRRSLVPILAMAVTDDEVDRVLALQSGADDCVPNKCSFYEISARVEALWRRSRMRQQDVVTDDSIEYFGLTLYPATREVAIGGAPVGLTDTEYQILALLIERAPAVTSRKQITESVWDSSWVGCTRTIDTHVSSVRAKLGSRTWIRSVRGVGYRMGTPRASVRETHTESLRA